MSWLAIRADSKSALNRVFFMLCISISISSFSYSFAYSTTGFNTFWFWQRIIFFGLITCTTSFIHFISILTGFRPFFKKYRLYYLIYALCLYFIYHFTVRNVHPYEVALNKWVYIEYFNMNSYISWLLLIYIFIIIACSFIFTWKWGKSTKNRLKKRQAVTILLMGSVALFVSVLSSTLLYIYNRRYLPVIFPIVSLIWISGIWLSVKYYGMMSINQQYNFEKIFDYMKDMIIITDMNLNILKVNLRIEMLTKFNRHELTGKNFDVLVSSKSNYNKKDFLDAIKNGGSYELSFKTIYNIDIPVNITASVINDKDNYNPIYTIIAQDLRLTRLIEHEILERTQLQNKLMRQKINFQQLFLNSPFAIAVLDNEDRIVNINESFTKLFGYNFDEVKGRNITNLLAPSDKIQESVDLLKVINDGGIVRTETIRMRKNGTMVDVSLTAYPVNIDNALEGKYCIYSDISHRKAAENKLKYLSTHDSLTGLLNRTYFEQIMNKYKNSTNMQMSIIICDVDGLKLVNDTFGHNIGDALLVVAAYIIKDSFEEDCIIARIGGDEFVVIVYSNDRNLIETYCSRIRKAIENYNIENSDIMLSISIGYAINENFSMNPAELFKEADNNMYQQKLSHSLSTRSAIVKTLMKTLEARDYITEGHADRLQDLVTKIAVQMKLSEREINDLRLLARFHDIGKVGIPDSILFKEGPLTPEETLEMQRHCDIGYRIAQSSPDLSRIAEGILKHHEWWNGQGYPFGLKGGEIPLECRILRIADTYDALTNDRPYRKALTHEQAIEEIKRNAGIQFDPYITEIFINMMNK